MLIKALSRHLGTIIPVLTLTAATAVLYGAVTDPPVTWERWVSYAFGGLFSLLGAYACVRIWRMSGRRFPSVFLLALFYESLTLTPVMGVLFVLAVDWVTIPEVLLFPLLVTSIVGITVSKLVLYLSARYDFLDEEADPVPFRSLFRLGRNRRN